MTVTLDDLVEYSQGIDARLATLDVNKLKDKIRYGVNNLATQELCFSTEETIPFNQFVSQELYAFTITPSKEIVNYFLTSVVSSVYDPFLLPPSDAVTIVINPDKSITVNVINPYQASLLALKIGYFYVPNILVDLEFDLEPEVHHLLKHALQVVLWGGLKDYEKEQYLQKALDAHAARKTISFPTEMEQPLKGGFI
jgi:hypothetical protein